MLYYKIVVKKGDFKMARKEYVQVLVWKDTNELINQFAENYKLSKIEVIDQAIKLLIKEQSCGN